MRTLLRGNEVPRRRPMAGACKNGVSDFASVPHLRLQLLEEVLDGHEIALDACPRLRLSV